MNYTNGLLSSLTQVKDAKTLRASSWDTTGRNNDAWNIAPGETRVLADIKGPGCINHIWMTQPNGYRNVLIQMFWDDEEHPSVLCPLGDFFGLGNEIVNSYEHGHGNHLSNETSSVAYWYQLEPHRPFSILPVEQRKPVLKDEDGNWIVDKANQTPSPDLVLNDEMKENKKQWQETH